VPQVQEKLGLDAPLAGLLMRDGVVEDGAEIALDEGPRMVESEVGVEIGEDGSSIAAVMPALELIDPPDLTQDVETILAGNIFHRAVAFGPRAETSEPGPGRIMVNGAVAHELSAEQTAGHLAAMVAAVAARLETAGEELAAGEIVITGTLAPPHEAAEGDVVRLELDAVGAVEMRFT
jgi:2-keto-4-pentenoate hydratase